MTASAGARKIAITVGSGVDDSVRRISTNYEIRGLREKLTSWDNATVGSGCGERSAVRLQ
ncbi:MAG: hypothetical protein R3C99_00315 [Pirellulaceae bacterium]